MVLGIRVLLKLIHSLSFVATHQHLIMFDWYGKTDASIARNVRSCSRDVCLAAWFAGMV